MPRGWEPDTASIVLGNCNFRRQNLRLEGQNRTPCERRGDVMSAVLDGALALAAREWPVFPCEPSPKPHPRAKAPLTANGLKDATTDPEAIREWWRRWPNALIGLPTGDRLGAFVVDLDPRTSSCEELLEALERHIGFP